MNVTALPTLSYNRIGTFDDGREAAIIDSAESAPAQRALLSGVLALAGILVTLFRAALVSAPVHAGRKAPLR